MSADRQVHIPRHAGSGISFAGADVKDAWIVISSGVLAIVAGGLLHLGTLAFIGFPVAGYFINRMYVDWKTRALPGQFQATLYRLGLSGYSRGFPTQAMVYVGDSQPGSGDSRRLVSEAIARLQASDEAGQRPGATQPAAVERN
jgi:hypothetical protein